MELIYLTLFHMHIFTGGFGHCLSSESGILFLICGYADFFFCISTLLTILGCLFCGKKCGVLIYDFVLFIFDL